MGNSIGDYAVIGDCRSAALVSRHGAVEWLCWPGFDSPSIFGRLIDRTRGGSWSISPVGPARVRRRYVGDTPVLRTEFSCPNGEFALTDFMAVASAREKRGMPQPEHELVRILTCERGEGEIAVFYAPRPGFGKKALLSSKPIGLRCVLPSGLLTLTGEMGLSPDSGVAFGRKRMRAGETLRFSLTFDSRAPAVLAPAGELSEDALRRSLRWWEDWSARCRYRGSYRKEVVRSAITLKLMGFSPSGTFIASPTTSLPERMGGALNWDYRFCWLRDSSLTIRALISLGYEEEAMAYGSWILHSTRLTVPRLGVLYDVYGRRPAREKELDLAGFRDSRPVRTGNAAMEQLQLDVYGELVDAGFGVLSPGKRIDSETREVFRLLGDFICGHWQETDSGIWEIRGATRRHTYSLSMCWVCLDRLLAFHRNGLLPGIDAGRFDRERARIRAVVERDCWNARLGSFVSTAGGEELDASLLLLPFYGFIAARDPRMRSTYERILGTLGAGKALFRRNRYFQEGAFAVCTCWAIDFLARGGGSSGEAREMFEAFLGYSNDLGLFGEEIDPASGEALGNFPLAFTHVGVINAALSIGEREGRTV